jgi:hypothetical protein
MLDRVFDRLVDPEFQDLGSGLMSFPAYIYVYKSDREYELREELPNLCERLKRPKVQPQEEQDPLLLNVYEAFLDYLEDRTLGGRPLLERILEQEESDSEQIEKQLKRHARSSEFVGGLAEQFEEYIQAPSEHKRSYVFLHGWGAIYPYLRASQFLDRMEGRLGDYKLILFYPGTYEDGQFHLFGELGSNRVYRASCLNEMIGE